MATRAVVDGCKIVLILVLNLVVHGQSAKNSTKFRRAIVPIATFYQPPSQPSNLNHFQYPTEYNYGYHSPVAQFFEHIEAPNYPGEIVVASQRVLHYLLHSPMNVNDEAQMVMGIHGLNSMDRMVAFLLRIQSDLPLDCSIKADISTLILYNMMKSYLNYVPVLQMAMPNHVDLYLHEESDRYREVIKTLLRKLRCCQAKVQSIHDEMAEMVSSRLQYQEHSTILPEVQVRLLEPVTTPAPEIITRIQYIEKPCPTLPPSTPPPPVTTVSPYLAYVDVVPKPTNGYERMKYEKITSLLRRSDFNAMLGQLDLSAGQTELARFQIILQAALHLQLEQATLDAIRYYIGMFKSVAALNLSMQKEIKKQFDLTKIFTATFNFEALSLEGQTSFDSFYNFLLGVTGEQLHSFTTWTDAHTKGEFIKILFEFFLQQDFTPVEVKAAINTLIPFVKFDGEGATPI